MLIRIHLSSIAGISISAFDQVNVCLPTSEVGNRIFRRPDLPLRRALNVNAGASPLHSVALVIQNELAPSAATAGWVHPVGTPCITPASM
jgi:hypothetical protein